MVVPYLARAVLVTPLRAVTSRPSWFDYIGSSASPSSTTAAIVSPSSSPACPHAPLVHDALPSVHDHSTAPPALCGLATSTSSTP
uniref:Uncharacterized protein n=1 Tax=Oryza meridionalis TaxID=40149 RepID=A0A0E0DGI5_9ORYZ